MYPCAPARCRQLPKTGHIVTGLVYAYKNLLRCGLISGSARGHTVSRRLRRSGEMPPSMSTRRQMSQSTWACKPGSFDALNTSRLFNADNSLGIPTLHHTPVSAVPEWLVAYRTRIRSPRFDFNRAAVHFFLDDYRFETVWTRPERALEHLRKYRSLLAPDFSLYADWPLVMQQWNVYRSRWCGRYWQELGFQVIPTVSWSTAESFAFCFDGLPNNSVVAVSAVGVDLTEVAQCSQFMLGFQEMVRWLNPSSVLAYGGLPEKAYELAQVVTYSTRWQCVHAYPLCQKGSKE